jgi:hypothetical protein
LETLAKLILGINKPLLLDVISHFAQTAGQLVLIPTFCANTFELNSTKRKPIVKAK